LKKISVAIDGHSSCGKSTLAKQIAKHFNYIYLDTGAMYRAVTLFAINQNIINKDDFDKGALIEKLPEINIEFKADENGKVNTYLNNQNVEEAIRTMRVSSFVSPIATVKEVREKMVELQQKMGSKGGVVMDGRDIGTVVLPKAELKVFMTAKDEIRAQRRFDELKEKGIDDTFENVLQNLKERDYIDSTREESPLLKAEDALVLDNSELSRDEQLEILKSWVEERGKL
jgi:cytidylate kinase